MSSLLDTNFVIGLLRGVQPYWDYLETLLEHTLPSISTITRAEVYAGCHPAEEEETRRILGCFRPVPIDDNIADLAGGCVYRFARQGITLHLEDALIGATAVHKDFVLITQNVSHFPMLSLGKNLIRFPVR
jgi:predicted nucleic acid-binding protein